MLLCGVGEAHRRCSAMSWPASTRSPSFTFRSSESGRSPRRLYHYPSTPLPIHSYGRSPHLFYHSPSRLYTATITLPYSLFPSSTHRLSLITYHLSLITYYLSLITCYSSPITFPSLSSLLICQKHGIALLGLAYKAIASKRKHPKVLQMYNTLGCSALVLITIFLR